MKKLLVLLTVCALAGAIMLGGCKKESGAATAGGEKKGALA
jgi:hypothetical protein